VLEDKEFIKRLKKKDMAAYKKLYDDYAPRMKYLLYRYVKSDFDLDELLQEGFITIFTKINQYKGNGSFEGWMKKIFINTALLFLRKNKKENQMVDIEQYVDRHALQDHEIQFDGCVESGNIKKNNIGYDLIEKADITDDDLLNILHLLPQHYRLVFDMYIIDNHKHKEIAQTLNINEKTSKSRLSKARAIVKNKMFEMAKERLTIQQNE